MSERKQVNVRLDERLIVQIDERAAKHKMSRNAWMELALERVVEMPSQITQQQKRF